MAEPSLTPTSYVVLGLVGAFGPCTSYDMKRSVAVSIGYFWSFPHSQLYAEPARLVELGLLSEERESTGRKRRLYALTSAGRRALRTWLAEPTDEPTEIRDLAILKLFFGWPSTRRSRATTTSSRTNERRSRWGCATSGLPSRSGTSSHATDDSAVSRYGRLASIVVFQ
jgi:DNA-binding PadR family transcriptional regulator